MFTTSVLLENQPFAVLLKCYFRKTVNLAKYIIEAEKAKRDSQQNSDFISCKKKSLSSDVNSYQTLENWAKGY